MYDNILIAGDSICLYEGENMRSKEFLFPDNYKIKKLVFTQDKRQVLLFNFLILVLLKFTIPFPISINVILKLLIMYKLGLCIH